MDSLSDVFGLCRLCLVQEHVNIPIFDDPDNVRQIPLKISSCLPVQVSREDNLPKKICDECSNKLDLCYDFWTSTANAEKTLLSTVEKQNQAPEPAAFQLFKTEPEYVAVPEEETQSQIPEPQVPEPILIKAESEEIEAPPAKRPRRPAAIKAQMHMAPESDDDEVTADQDFNGAEDEVEEEIDDPDVPDMSVDIDEVKPGTSGLNLEIADSKLSKLNKFDYETSTDVKEEPYDSKIEVTSCSIDDKKPDESELLGTYTDSPTEHLGIQSGEKAFQCPECGRCFTRKTHWRVHLLAHRGEKSFTCRACNKSFARRNQLIIHERKHTGEKPHKCKHCGKCFADPATLYQHVRTHSGEKPNKCKECGKGFLQKGHLRRHLMTHANEKPFKCQECGKCFLDGCYLNVHLRIHSGEKPYKCTECSKTFVSRTQLTKHSRIHTGEKPFICSVCDKDFTRASNLNMHMRTHTGEKPFKCEVCDKCFTIKSTLDRHVRGHSGEKPYKCTKCEKCFSDRSNLYAHLRNIHKSEREKLVGTTLK